MKNQIYITAIYPKPLASQARIEAARRGISRSALLRQALAEYLKLRTKEGIKK